MYEEVATVGITDLDSYPVGKCKKYYKQCIEIDSVCIPHQKPCVESVNDINVKICVNDVKTIQTILGPKLIVKGTKNIKVMYTANNCEQSVHSAHWSIPFCEFILLDEKCYKNCCSCISEVFVGVEYVCVRKIKDRYLDCCILYILCPHIKGTCTCCEHSENKCCHCKDHCNCCGDKGCHCKCKCNSCKGEFNPCKKDSYHNENYPCKNGEKFKDFMKDCNGFEGMWYNRDDKCITCAEKLNEMKDQFVLREEFENKYYYCEDCNQYENMVSGSDKSNYNDESNSDNAVKEPKKSATKDEYYNNGWSNSNEKDDYLSKGLYNDYETHNFSEKGKMNQNKKHSEKKADPYTENWNKWYANWHKWNAQRNNWYRNWYQWNFQRSRWY